MTSKVDRTARSKKPPASEPPPAKWNLRLYVAGDSPKSRTALENLTRLCEMHLRDNYHIEVVDLRKKPELARADEILAVPTLIRKIPEPMKRVIGDLSNAERALLALELPR
ncbi:MAG: circadian clock KaiB family protein [Polyangiaceae bacterium]